MDWHKNILKKFTEVFYLSKPDRVGSALNDEADKRCGAVSVVGVLGATPAGVQPLECKLVMYFPIHTVFGFCTCVEMYLSNFRLRASSAPYLPTVPLSTSRKCEWRWFRGENLVKRCEVLGGRWH